MSRTHDWPQISPARRGSQVRLNTLGIIDELFLRSKQFRGLLTEEFSSILLLAVGHKADKPLPPPASAAQRLRQCALECIERWDDQFGALYGQVRSRVLGLATAPQWPFYATCSKPCGCPERLIPS